MKKLIAIFAVTIILTACQSTSSDVKSTTDTTSVKHTIDTLSMDTIKIND